MANVNNYIRAGQAGAQASVNIFSAIRDNAPKYDRIANASIAENAKTKATYTRNEAEAAISRIRAERDLEATKQDVRAGKEISGIRKNARMTGMLAGGAALLGIGAMQMNKKDEPDPTLGILSQQLEAYKQRIADAKADYDRIDGESYTPPNIDSSTNDTSSTKNDSSVSGKTDNPISSFQATGKKGKWTVADMTKLAEQAGFSPENARIMGAIGMAESGGNATIDTSQTIDPGKKNEYSIGLFQVNAQAHGDKLAKLGYTEDDLRDPFKAAKVAKMVYDEVGSFRPWSVYKSGAYADYLPK